MSLTINKFLTHCQVPRRLQVARTLTDRVACEHFAAECARQLSPRWPAQPDVIRIRRLPVRLRISPAQLNDDSLVRVWVSALGQALFTALAQPTGAGSVEIARAENRAAWLSAVISDLLVGVAAQHWEYEEFQEFLGLGTAEAILALLDREPSEIVPILLILETRGLLDRLLALYDELAMERLFVMVARGYGSSQAQLSIEDLLTIGQLILSQPMPRVGESLANRTYALRLFLVTIRDHSFRVRDGWSPRLVLYALMGFSALLELTDSTDPAEWSFELSAKARLGQLHHAAIAELLGEILALVQKNYHTGQKPNGVDVAKLHQLADLIANVRPFVPAMNSHAKNKGIRLVSSDCAGLLLLAGLLHRLEWPQSILHSTFGATHGLRAITYIFAGLGLTILNRFGEKLTQLDPGLALFAGWENDPDVAGLQHFFAMGTPSERRELLAEFVPKAKTLESNVESWRATLDHAAELMIGEFASRVRGFRQASRAFIVKHCFALPGRIRVEESRLVIALAASPFHVALHLSGMDEPVEAVQWLGGRRLEFQLEGL